MGGGGAGAHSHVFQNSSGNYTTGTGGGGGGQGGSTQSGTTSVSKGSHNVTIGTGGYSSIVLKGTSDISSVIVDGRDTSFNGLIASGGYSGKVTRWVSHYIGNDGDKSKPIKYTTNGSNQYPYNFFKGYNWDPDNEIEGNSYSLDTYYVMMEKEKAVMEVMLQYMPILMIHLSCTIMMVY